jgi:predicted  nucleic acid-binding Zn-ribbon protein
MRAKMDYGLDILVRMLYLEPAVRQRRILVLGKGAETMASVLGRMGAAEVRTHEPGAPRSLPWDLGGLRGKRDVDAGSSIPVKRGEVDIVFIPDLAQVDDYRAILGEAARVLDRDALLMLSVRNAECTVPISETGLEQWPEVWSLDSLEQLLGQYFAHVDVSGQSPFLGYAMASYDAARGRAGVRLDTSLMDSCGEDPEFIVAICSHDAPREPLTNALFQMPMAEMALVEGRPPRRAEGESADERRMRSELESFKRELGNRNVVISRLEKEIERIEGEAEAGRQKMFDMRQKLERERKGQQKEAIENVMRQEVGRTPETWIAERATLSRELEEQTRLRAQAEKALAEIGQELERANGKAVRFESREKDGRARMERSEGKTRELRVQVKQLEARLREEETRTPEMGRRIQELERELDAAAGDLLRCNDEREDLRAQIESLQGRLGAARDAEVSSREEVSKARARIRELSSELEIRTPSAPVDDGEVARLTAELERRDELVRDLIRELEVLPTVIEQERADTGPDAHDLVGELERLKGQNEELTHRSASLVSDLDEMRSRLEEAQRQTREAAALVTMVDDALDSAAVGTPPGSVGDQALDRFLRDLQEDLRRIAGDPRARDVAREIGLVWVSIENKRRMQ